MRRIKGILILTSALIAGAVIGAAPAGAAAKKPDLKAQSVSATPAAAVPGTTLTVRATVKNAGRGAAAATKSEAFLSLDRKLSKGDFSIRRVGTSKLKSGKSAKNTISGAVPTGIPAGSYFVLVCADAAKKLKESNESNGCGSSKSPISVTVVVPSPPTPVPQAPPIPTSGPVGGAASVCGGASAPIMNGHVPNGYHLTISPAPLSFDGGGVQADYVYPEDVPSAYSLVYTLTNDGTASTPLISTDVFGCNIVNPTGFPSNRGSLNEHLQPNPDLGGADDCYGIVLDPGESCKGELFIDRAESAGTFAGVVQIEKQTPPGADLAVFPVESSIYSRPFFSFSGIEGSLPGSTVPMRDEDIWVEAENIGTTGGIPSFELDTTSDGKFAFLGGDPAPSGYSRCAAIAYDPGESCALQIGFCSSVAGSWQANLLAYGTLPNLATNYNAPWSGDNEYSVTVGGTPDPGSCPS